MSITVAHNPKGPFTLSDYNCESDVADIWVLFISMELFTFSEAVKDQRKIMCSLSQWLSVNGPSRYIKMSLLLISKLTYDRHCHKVTRYWQAGSTFQTVLVHSENLCYNTISTKRQTLFFFVLITKGSFTYSESDRDLRRH